MKKSLKFLSALLVCFLLIGAVPIFPVIDVSAYTQMQ